MGHSLLKHNTRCGGDLHLDITKMFSIRTPSVSFTREGIFIGVTELQLASSTTSSYELSCEKCRQNIQKDEFEKHAGVTCMICRKTKSIAQVFCCTQISAICQKCAEFLSIGNKENAPDYIEAIKSVIRISKDMKLMSYSEILQQDIRI